jgi:hypothetical protein
MQHHLLGARSALLILIASLAGPGSALWGAAPPPDPNALPPVVGRRSVLGTRQPPIGPQTGNWELTLGGSGSSNQDFDAGSFGVAASLGYFVSDPIEVVVRQNFAYSDTGETTWLGQTRGAVDYHFSLERFQPFVGASFGGVYGDGATDSWAAGLEGGLKYYVLPKTFLFGLVEYQWFFKDTSDFSDNFSDGAFTYAIGIGFNF